MPLLRKCSRLQIYKITGKFKQPYVYEWYQDIWKSEKELEARIQIIRIYNRDIGMEFVIEKCVLLMMKMRKRETMEGIELSGKL